MSEEQFKLFEDSTPPRSKPASSKTVRRALRKQTGGGHVKTTLVTFEQAQKIISTREGQFYEVKAIEITPRSLSKTISAFSNSEGGDLYIGVWEGQRPDNHREWRGFSNEESANAHLATFEELFPLGPEYQYEFLGCDDLQGLVLHVQVHKARQITKASNGIPYIRRGAQNLAIDTKEKLTRLEYSKGIASFEESTVDVPLDLVVGSDIIKWFMKSEVPTAKPLPWLTKQLFIRAKLPTVAAVLVFADEPQAILPKRCGIKLYRYKTKESAGFRDALAFHPKTIEGCLYSQIKEAVHQTTEITESIPKLGPEDLEQIIYPSETLHEIITNAVLHRDYSIADDVHVRVFDNRIEVQSPGKLPAPVTVQNILKERQHRNGGIVRMLNRFPDPPNKDVGEGLNTAFRAMHKLGLKEPAIYELENSVLVIIRHELLASPEEAIMDFLDQHETIRNKQAREITHIPADHKVKNIFRKMVSTGMIEQIPGTITGGIKYRKVRK